MSGLAQRREFLAGAAIVVLIVGFTAGKRVVRALAPAPSEEQCAALFDRWFEQQSRQEDPLVEDGDIDRAREEAHAAPEYLAELHQCQKQLTASEVECGLRAPDVDDLERCVQ